MISMAASRAPVLLACLCMSGSLIYVDRRQRFYA